MKPTYLKVKVQYFAPEQDALQEIVNGVVTRYVTAAGKVIEETFATCRVADDEPIPTPDWAPDVPEPETEQVEENPDA
ncbi:hypothetical protein [Aestuariivirga litoralis]|uniref:hypothetical protein n=1 Tax=Aestuariivirga litoralis TaxID=2650924 RepID=UPI0018C8522D|nr:hypothetical protein [Aestuariivirga litoralis]MBG1232964.1 hypothetical protein [Aestuariivirga litoralis]